MKNTPQQTTLDPHIFYLPQPQGSSLEVANLSELITLYSVDALLSTVMKEL